MPRDTGIAQRLRDAGLRVTECAGWQTRGSDSFNPRGSVNHHTAGSPNGATPSLNGIINGFSGSAPGPLANAMQSREPNGDDIFYVVAAGRANHAGEGGWRGLSGNSSVYGLEIEHTGTSPLPIGRQQLAARFHAAVLAGRGDASMVCQHSEWAPNRKIDAATNVDANQFRTWVAQAMAGGLQPTPTPPPEVRDMWTTHKDCPAGTSRNDFGSLVIGLPANRKNATVTLYCPCDPKEGASLWAALGYKGTKQGLWSGGNTWEMWLPGQTPQAITVPNSAQSLEVHHMGGTKASVTVTLSGE